MVSDKIAILIGNQLEQLEELRKREKTLIKKYDKLTEKVKRLQAENNRLKEQLERGTCE